MNDQEFTERLLANPQDSAPDFLAAVQEHPAREAQRGAARSFDALLRRELTSVSASAELRAKLLKPEQLESARVGNSSLISSQYSANDSFLRRALPVAACLLVAVGLAVYSRTNMNEGLNAGLNAALEAEIFTHVYREAFVLENDQVLAVPEFNARLEEMGVQLANGGDAGGMEVTFAQYCWIANQVGVHLVMHGTNGPVSVMMIPNTPVASEFDIHDDRFDGLVTPTAAGNLVVIGEKQEAIAEYRNLVSRNLKWDY